MIHTNTQNPKIKITSKKTKLIHKTLTNYSREQPNKKTQLTYIYTPNRIHNY